MTQHLARYARSGLPVACFLVVASPGARAHVDLEARLEWAGRAVGAAPASPDPLLRRAELHRLRGDFPAAHADLDRAAALAPGLRETVLLRADLLLAQGHAERAHALLEGLVRDDPDDVAAQISRARSLVELGRPRAAADAYGEALERMPLGPPDLYIERARALEAAGPPHATAALANLDEGIERLGPLPTLTREALELEIRTGRTDAALARLDAEIARSARPLGWRVRKAEVLVAAGRRAEATEVVARAWDELLAQPEQRRRQRGWRRLEARLRAATPSAPTPGGLP